jgi:hypothetical protein
LNCGSFLKCQGIGDSRQNNAANQIDEEMDVLFFFHDLFSCSLLLMGTKSMGPACAALVIFSALKQ